MYAIRSYYAAFVFQLQTAMESACLGEVDFARRDAATMTICCCAFRSITSRACAAMRETTDSMPARYSRSSARKAPSIV